MKADLFKVGVRGTTLSGLLDKDQDVFDAGLRLMVKAWEKHERRLLRDKGDHYKKKGLPTPPTTYWSMECMGLALLGLKRGLKLNVKNSFIPENMLEGCVEEK